MCIWIWFNLCLQYLGCWRFGFQPWLKAHKVPKIHVGNQSQSVTDHYVSGVSKHLLVVGIQHPRHEGLVSQETILSGTTACAIPTSNSPTKEVVERYCACQVYYLHLHLCARRSPCEWVWDQTLTLRTRPKFGGNKPCNLVSFASWLRLLLQWWWPLHSAQSDWHDLTTLTR